MDDLLAEVHIELIKAYDAREEPLGAAVELARLAVARAGSSAQLRVSLGQIESRILVDTHREVEALARLELALAAAEESDNELAKAALLGYRAFALVRLGRSEEALAEARRGIEIDSRILGELHERTIDARRNLAGVLFELRRYDEARHEMDEIIAVLERSPRLRHLTLPQMLLTAAMIDLKTDAYEAGLAKADRAMALDREDGSEVPAITREAEHLRAAALSKLGRHDEAIEAIRIAIDLGQRSHDEDSSSVLSVRYALADILQLAGRPAEAVAEFDALLRDLPPDHPMRNNVIAGRGLALEKLGDPEAVTVLEQAVAMKWDSESDREVLTKALQRARESAEPAPP